MNGLDPESCVAGMILGNAASSGLARGRAVLCDCARRSVVPRRELGEGEAFRELERFDEAVAAVERTLSRLFKSTAEISR